MITWKACVRLILHYSNDVILFSKDKQKVLYSALVCTLIFSTAESPPVSVYGKYNLCNVIMYVLYGLFVSVALCRSI